MTRNFDLIRKILLEVQNLPAGTPPICLEYPNEFEQAVVNEHISLLIEAGLLNGKIIKSNSGILETHVFGLTWAGHDFIDVTKDEKIWNKTKAKVLSSGMSYTFDILKECLAAAAKAALGLP